MKTKVAKTKKANKKAAVIEVDPFATAVVDNSAKKPTARKTATVRETRVISETPKKAARKSAKKVTLDPFAEIAVEAVASSPAKKRGAKTASKAVAVKAVSETTTVAAGQSKSAIKATKTKSIKKTDLDVTNELAASEPKADLSPVFKALAEVKLPELKRENRARLQMQTPTRLYFYWSIRENPWHTLRNVFGDDLGSYTLVVKLIDKRTDRETISQCEAEGNWWFDVEPDGEYQAEIGFYAPNRPYFRIVYSNTISTPRRSPSPRAATESDWTVSANKFAEVLDVAGFSRDAFDAAMAGDDVAASSDASHTAFTRLVGNNDNDIRGIAAEEIRYALVALASGTSLEELRFRISPALFAILQANAANIEAGRAMSALTEYFDIEESDWTEEKFGPAVYGASLINFPRTLKTKSLSPKYTPRYDPVSSHSIR
ncbi:MAG: DUF4912 domain-containing protein [Pyrinomonadaceae bacterium]|nr:DUF4912 domain-containing protein [Pyrinomonadaceae bacterium]